MSVFDWLDEQRATLQREGLWRDRHTCLSTSGGWCERNGRRLRNFASNDYLDLAHDPRLAAAAKHAADRSGTGATASPLVVGRTAELEQLELALARFEGEESAIVFPSGYAANLGTVSALVTSDDIVFADRFNHACLMDGVRLSGARLRIYRHHDLAVLERELQQARTHSGRRFLVTDTLFSMDGDAAPLPELLELADRYDAFVIADEAHGTGLFGDHGRGVAEWLGVRSPRLIRTGTLSKALGTQGGFVAGPSRLTDHLWNRSRPLMFSTALSPLLAAAARCALELVALEPERRSRLLALSAHLRTALCDAGARGPELSVGPIIPVLVGEPALAVEMARRCEDEGCLVAAIRPPTVPQGTSRLRISLTAAHTADDVEKLVHLVRSFLVP